MAEVFLAVQEGLGGFEKLVVVKRIFPQYCEDDHFVSMFLQEARLAASIRHTNVVHIIDIDRDDDGYLLVMEYLSGESLAYVWEALRARREKVPWAIVCRIGASIAAGLHHAHIATDAAGNPQPIVHRDVTPSNLIVTYQGVVKVVDFGVAKATLTEGQTRAGALKGKMSYLSPEQIEDEPIDGRADVFQLGICLHEMLTGRRLFKGKTDHHKMQAVMEKEIVPPSQWNAEVPAAVDDVVLKALERDLSKRYQSADEFRRALEHAMRQSGESVSDADVGDWMRATFPMRLQERRALERDAVAQVREGRPADGSRPGLAMLTESSSRARGYKTPTMAGAVEHYSRSHVTGMGRRAGIWAALGIAGFVGLVSAIAWQAGQGGGASSAEKGAVAAKEPSPASPAAAEPETKAGTGEGIEAIEPPAAPAADPAKRLVYLVATPQTAEIYIDGERVGIGSFEKHLDLAADEEHQLRVTAPGYVSYESSFTTELPKVVRLTRVRHKADAGVARAAKAAAAKAAAAKKAAEAKAAAEKKAAAERAAAEKRARKERTRRRTRRKEEKRWSSPRHTDNRNPFAH